MITIPQRLAKRWNASVVAPGIDSARWKLSWSSLWQKYSVAKSYCVQTIFAPSAADCSTLERVAWRLVAGSLSALACISASVTCLLSVDMLLPGPASDARAKRSQFTVDILVAAVDVVNTIDPGGAFCGKPGEHKRGGSP